MSADNRDASHQDIKLVPLQENHIDDEYVSWHDNSDGHLSFYTGSGRVFTRDVLIEDYRRGKETGNWFYYLIEAADGQKIGNIKIGPIDWRNKTSDMPCLIGNRDVAGRGVGTRAILLGNEVAFRDYGIRRLHGGMHASNYPSIKAYTRANWVIEATLKGYYLVQEQAVDRVCVACFNPIFFPHEHAK